MGILLFVRPPIPTYGLSLWLKADAGVALSGSNVTSWRDQSPFGVVVAPNSQNAPTFIPSFVNGRPAIQCNSASIQGLSTNNFVVEDNWTFFSVTKRNPEDSGRIFSTYFNNFLIGSWYGYSDRFYGNDENGWLYEGENTSENWTITTAYAAGYPSLNYFFRQNGSTLISLNSTATMSIDGLSFGGGILNGGEVEEPSNCCFSEFIIYSRVLNSTERTQVETYLNTKYAVY
jgi:hypothetical protein